MATLRHTPITAFPPEPPFPAPVHPKSPPLISVGTPLQTLQLCSRCAAPSAACRSPRADATDRRGNISTHARAAPTALPDTDKLRRGSFLLLLLLRLVLLLLLFLLFPLQLYVTCAALAMARDPFPWRLFRKPLYTQVSPPGTPLLTPLLSGLYPRFGASASRTVNRRRLDENRGASSPSAAAAAARCLDLDFSFGFQEMCGIFFFPVLCGTVSCRLPLLEQPRPRYVSLHGEQKLVVRERERDLQSFDLPAVLRVFPPSVSSVCALISKFTSGNVVWRRSEEGWRCNSWL